MSKPPVLLSDFILGHSNLLGSCMLWDKELLVRTAGLWVSLLLGGRMDISARKTQCPG